MYSTTFIGREPDGGGDNPGNPAAARNPASGIRTAGSLHDLMYEQQLQQSLLLGAPYAQLYAPRTLPQHSRFCPQHLEQFQFYPDFAGYPSGQVHVQGRGHEQSREQGRGQNSVHQCHPSSRKGHHHHKHKKHRRHHHDDLYLVEAKVKHHASDLRCHHSPAHRGHIPEREADEADIYGFRDLALYDSPVNRQKPHKNTRHLENTKDYNLKLEQKMIDLDEAGLREGKPRGNKRRSGKGRGKSIEKVERHTDPERDDWTSCKSAPLSPTRDRKVKDHSIDVRLAVSKAVKAKRKAQTRSQKEEEPQFDDLRYIGQ